MLSLDELLGIIKKRAIEKIVYTRNGKSFEVGLEELPPIIPEATRAENVLSTEHKKHSALLRSSQYNGM